MAKKFNIYSTQEGKWRKIGVGKKSDKALRLWFFRDVPLREWLVILKKDIDDDNPDFPEEIDE